ncbi:helix-turn-helix domain-containing protein [Amphritea pacifica]|uniref:Helix-turn-helix transcriptional regulator n=1 Tax=Amphritea pacifica TaxID=2811233 RepID=A0ABS2WAS9_9GAMM|nr:helix-turn-helix transcriptional regulator [Amphritea pacifica]MBN0988814.1 helix-turn-helix transcriptional regulator [Amphritea pacifica]
MNSLLEQIKKRRIALKLKQHDMMLRVGISRQQYQRLESKGNPRLDTLELVAKGLKSELLLIPQEKLNAVLAVLADDTISNSGPSTGAPTKPSQTGKEQCNPLADDPWQGLQGENE